MQKEYRFMENQIPSYSHSRGQREILLLQQVRFSQRVDYITFIVRILTIDYDRSFVPDAEQPEYGWLSIGSAMNQRVSLENGGDNNMIPIQVILIVMNSKTLILTLVQKK